MRISKEFLVYLRSRYRSKHTYFLIEYCESEIAEVLMDPLSITASIITVIDAANKIVKYILDVKNASFDSLNLTVSYNSESFCPDPLDSELSVVVLLHPAGLLINISDVYDRGIGCLVSQLHQDFSFILSRLYEVLLISKSIVGRASGPPKRVGNLCESFETSRDQLRYRVGIKITYLATPCKP